MFFLNFSMFTVISITTLATFCLGDGLNHDERCKIIEGNGIKVDQCDALKHLVCQDGRCQCPDPTTQVYTYRNEPVTSSRTRRSPGKGKKGGSGGIKRVAAGVVAGAAGYHVVNQVRKGVSNGFTTTAKPPKSQRVYACYSRVGAECALNFDNWVNISTTTTAPEVSSTTQVNNVTLSSDNSSTTTTTTQAPSTSSTTETAPVQVSKLQCVQYATCKPRTTPSSSTNASTSASVGFHQKVDFDPRVGVCECESGYKKNSRDLCIKEK